MCYFLCETILHIGFYSNPVQFLFKTIYVLNIHFIHRFYYHLCGYIVIGREDSLSRKRYKIDFLKSGVSRTKYYLYVIKFKEMC